MHKDDDVQVQSMHMQSIVIMEVNCNLMYLSKFLRHAYFRISYTHFEGTCSILEALMQFESCNQHRTVNSLAFVFFQTKNMFVKVKRLADTSFS